MLAAGGEELYKTDTARAGTTSVVRFQRQASVGLVSVEIGKIEPMQPGGSSLLLCENGMQIILRPPVDRCVSMHPVQLSVWSLTTIISAR